MRASDAGSVAIVPVSGYHMGATAIVIRKGPA
jgi:hypothetical protein